MSGLNQENCVTKDHTWGRGLWLQPKQAFADSLEFSISGFSRESVQFTVPKQTGGFMDQRRLPNHKGFLVRCTQFGNVNGKSHLWTGSDTACRLWSTGLSESDKKYKVTSEPMTQLCSLCHPERYDIDLWIRESVALGAAQPYTLFNEQG